MQFIVSFELYIDIGTRYIPSVKTYFYHWNQNTNKTDNKCSSLQRRYLVIYVYLYLIIELCLFV